MTDLDSLFSYRIRQAHEILLDAEKLIKSKASTTSIVNRAYYSVFYSLLALFLKTNLKVKTSKHIGVISVFDKEFIKTGKFDKKFSVIVHDLFDAR